MSQLHEAFRNVGMDLMSEEKACRILALVHFARGRFELASEQHFYNAIRIAQQQLGFQEGQVPAPGFTRIYALAQELNDQGDKCPWLQEFAQEYPALRRYKWNNA